MAFERDDIRAEEEEEEEEKEGGRNADPLGRDLLKARTVLIRSTTS